MKPQWIVATNVSSILFLAGYLVPLPSSMCRRSLIGWWCRQRTFFINNVDWIAFLILSANVILTAFFIWVLISFTKDNLLLYLARICKRQARKDNGRIDRTVLESIGELGEFCDAGRDKETVLDTLSSLADLNLALDSWVYLACTVRETIVSGNERNYIHAMGILQDMFRKASDTNIEETESEEVTGEKTEGLGQENDRDIHLASMLQELENVMIQAFTIRNPRVTATILTGYDELALQAPNAYAHAFFRIGKAGLSLDETQQVLAVLDKFHTKVTELLNSSDNAPDDVPEAVHVFFGLLAHFWHHGNSARQHALTYLEALATLPRWDAKRVDEHTQKAKAFFQHSLETADYLEQMLFESNLRQFVKDRLSETPQLEEPQRQRILTHYPSLEALHQATLEGIMACGISKAVAEIIYSQSRLAATSYSQNMSPIDAIKQWMTRFLRGRLHLQ